MKQKLISFNVKTIYNSPCYTGTQGKEEIEYQELMFLLTGGSKS